MKKVIINPIGGLANRMRAIASAVSLARAAECECRIKWPVNAELFCGFEKLFEKVGDLPPIENISAQKDFWIYGYARKKNLYLSALMQIGKYDLKIMPEIDERMHNSSPSDLIGLVQNHPNKDILIRTGLEFYPYESEFYRTLFHPKEDIIKEAQRRVPDKNRYIGLHIRRTDNEKSIRFSPIELFMSKIEEEFEVDAAVKFYLATDDESVKKELSERFGDRINYSSEAANRGSETGIIEGLTEMMALSLCRKIYGSYWSSFSEAAGMMGNVEVVQLSNQ